MVLRVLLFILFPFHHISNTIRHIPRTLSSATLNNTLPTSLSIVIQKMPTQNPLIERYETFVSTTPLVTRVTLTSLVVCYLLSWALPLESSLCNTPLFTAMHLEVYRLLLSPLVSRSLLSLAFGVSTLGGLLKSHEATHGSTHTLLHILQLTLLTNVAFLTLSVFLYYATSEPTFLLIQMSGPWQLIIPLLTESCTSPSSPPTRRLLFLPVQIPSKYYPIALTALFSLLGGIRFDLIVSLAVGYARTQGLVPIDIKDATVESAEAGPLRNLAGMGGFVGRGGAGGAYEVQSQSQPQAPAQPQSGWQPQVFGGETVAQMPGPGSVASPTFPTGSQGRTVGGGRAGDAREAARRAAERRAREGGGDIV